MTKTCCPKCKSTTELSVELKQSYELDWNDRHGEYVVGDSLEGRPGYEDDSEVTCSCGWSGRFDELKSTTEKYRIVLIVELEAERDSIGNWDWKEKLDLYSNESVTVDGVNKL